MLQLIDIKKDYIIGKEGKKDYQKTEALKGVSISFRKSEFVSILGPSGCGKTTLLNIVGGLDNYTSGDLVINGISTKNYLDKDWDNYRNHSIGFIFQNYNLIPHQTVLQNVELALTLSGISKAERVERATKVLEQVGLKDKLKSRPNQLSGGQMQRVAIARALINNPDIILADEPTGALDSKTSVQIMEILKEISKDKLIIMVTHNPELANEYSTRIIKLLDGELIADSNPFDSNETENNEIKEEIQISPEVEKTIENCDTNELVCNDNQVKEKAKKKKVKSRNMSLFTALSLSLNNLLTKKARTFLVAFAGSIGIIGIALILSISNGVQLYINKVQEDTLSAYPITLDTVTSDYSALFGSMVETGDNERDTSQPTIYVDDSMANMLNSMQSSLKTNDLESFYKYLNENYDEIKDCVNAIRYTYNFDMQIFSNDGKTQINPTTIFQNMGEAFESMVSMADSSSMTTMLDYMKVFEEMIDNTELLETQYDVVAVSEGKNKDDLFKDLKYNEVVLVLDKKNQISNMALYMLGIKDQSTLEDVMNDIMSGKEIESANNETFSFDDFLNRTFKILLTTDYYEESSNVYYTDANGKEYKTWYNNYELLNDTQKEDFIKNNGIEVKIVGIIRPNDEGVNASISGVIGYNKELTNHIMSLTNNSDIVKQQKELKDYNVITGAPFEVTVAQIDEWWNSLSMIEKMMAQSIMQFSDYTTFTETEKYDKFYKKLIITVEEIDEYYIKNKSKIDALFASFSQPGMEIKYESLTDNMKKIFLADSINAKHTYSNVLVQLGAATPEIPYTISLYAVDFESKDKIAEFIAKYNDSVDEKKKITYTDFVALLMSSITTIVNAISYVLIAFVSVSLVVSSIMIGIITYISVLERIKEIGILRSIGASKKDIKRVFTSESVIIGTIAGLVGIGITLLLTIPINIIIKILANISGIAQLPLLGAVILILISMFLTFIAGLLPAKIASKKDPVIALRTE